MNIRTEKILLYGDVVQVIDTSWIHMYSTDFLNRNHRQL